MTQPVWCPFAYREFYDVPRDVLIEWRGSLYLLESLFEDDKDEYSERYAVYRLEHRSIAELEVIKDWRLFAQLGHKVGSVEVRASLFDETRRTSIDASFLEDMV